MRLTRRQALGLIAGAGTGAALAGCGGPREVEGPSFATDPDFRFLSRAAFGPRPGDVEELRKIGRPEWLRRQLEPDAGEPWELDARLARLETTHLQAWELRDWPKNDVVRQAQQADLLYAVLSPWQVRERMVDFWTNHFNIYGNKGLAAYRIPSFVRDVVRRHAVGSFHAMLRESAKHTAMLLYLDQQASTWAHPNENYARELLELHTLGVEGGYTQQDVMEVARCFTGWTEERGFLKRRGSFKFDERLHDRFPKTVLGETIAEGGVEDGERVIEILARHPRTARYLARKLCRYFLGYGTDGAAPSRAPDGAGLSAAAATPSRIEEAVAAAYLEHPVGDIGRMLLVIFESDEFLNGVPTFKRPFDFLVSSMRALDASTDGNKPVLRHLELMGQPTHLWPMPDGYPVEAEAWNGSALGRWNFALALCRGKIRGTGVDLEGLAKRYSAKSRDDWMSAVLGVSSERLGGLPAAVAAHTKERPASAQDWADLTALCLCAPEFQWR